MGGLNSGRKGGHPTVEGCASLVLSVNRVMRNAHNAARQMNLPQPLDDEPLRIPLHAWRWIESGETEPWAAVEMRLEVRARDGTAWLRHHIDHATHATGPQDYSVSLVATPCRFGGQRWWWICPATCRRVAKLYLPNGGQRFLSRGRGAYLLNYASQRHGSIDRIHDRSRKLFERLGEHYSGLYGKMPSRPKGMHRRTYDAICTRLEKESNDLDKGLMLVTERFMRREAHGADNG